MQWSLADMPAGGVPAADHYARSFLNLSDMGWNLSHQRPWPTPATSHDTRATALEHELGKLNNSHELIVKDTRSAQSKVTKQPRRLSDLALAQFLLRTIAQGTRVKGVTLPQTSLAELLPFLANPDITALAASLTPGLAEQHESPGMLNWDAAAIQQRRYVLKSRFLSAYQKQMPHVSMVLVTKRPDELERILPLLQQQRYPAHDLVIGLHGFSLTSMQQQHLQELTPQLPLTYLALSADLVFGEALNQAFSVAEGDILTKIDDDDYYGPDHLWDLVLALDYSKAALVGKSTNVVYLTDLQTTVRRVFGNPEMDTHRVAGGTMTFSRDTFKEIPWSPVPQGVDTALLASIKEAGARIYYPHDMGYLYMRSATQHANHTWNTGLDHFLQNSRQQWPGLLEHPEFGTMPPPRNASS